MSSEFNKFLRILGCRNDIRIVDYNTEEFPMSAKIFIGEDFRGMGAALIITRAKNRRIAFANCGGEWCEVSKSYGTVVNKWGSIDRFVHDHYFYEHIGRAEGCYSCADAFPIFEKRISDVIAKRKNDPWKYDPEYHTRYSTVYDPKEIVLDPNDICVQARRQELHNYVPAAERKKIYAEQGYF